MNTIVYSAAEQREMLIRYLNQPEVVHREHPLMRKFDALIGDCLVSEEITVGVALITLLAARSANLEAQAAGAILEVIANRPGRMRTCRVCGCTDLDCSQCVARTGHPCHWVAEDLCSACVVAGEGGAS